MNMINTFQDSYHELFDEVKGGDNSIDSDSEWRRFVEIGIERKLFKIEDADTLKNVWKRVGTQANAFGHSRDARLTFAKLRELLIHEYSKNTDSMNDLYEMLRELPSTCKNAMSISSTDKAGAYRKIDRKLRDLENISKDVKKIAQNNNKILAADSFYSDVSQDVSNTNTSDFTFLRFQEQNASEISRRSSGLVLTTSRIRAATKSKSRAVDRFGLALELDRTGLLNFAVLSMLETTEPASSELREERKKKKKKNYVQIVVAAPVSSIKDKRKGISTEDWRYLLNAQEAHRQLLLSKHFPNALGMHRSGIRAHTAFAYEYIRVVRNKEADRLNLFSISLSLSSFSLCLIISIL